MIVLRRVLLTALLGLFLLGLPLACKKTAPEDSGPPTKAGDPFVEKLVDTEFVQYAIAIGGGGRLTYETMEFRADRSWIGNATLELADEPYVCQESGTWQLEGNESIDADNGRLMMFMDATDCPGREAPTKWKVEIRLSGKGGRPEIVDL